MFRLKFYALMFALVIGLLTAFNQTARAESWSWENLFSFESSANYTVNQTGDTGDGTCDASCTLRDAVNSANGTPEADTIVFDASVFGSNQTIVLNSGFTIASSGGKLTITGPAAGVTLTRNPQQFFLRGFANGGELELNNLTLTDFAEGGAGAIENGGTLTLKNSTVSGNRGYGGGAGIYNTGTATIENSIIRDNFPSLNGSGIYNVGTLTLKNSTVSGNTAEERGGGIYNEGTLTLQYTTVENNGAGQGAGIYNRGLLTIELSTIRNNSSSGSGGGIFLETGAATIRYSTVRDNTKDGVFNLDRDLTIENSTFSGNTGFGIRTQEGLTIRNSTVSGNTNGGIDTFQSNVTIENSTISDNGGIGLNKRGGNLWMYSTIIANSTSADCVHSDSFPTLNAYNSLIEGGLACVTGDNQNNRTGDPLLGSLQDNGGPTFTHALLLGSPAIDAGGSSTLATDQRGAGFPRIVGASVDIGAFELGDSNPTPTPTPTPTVTPTPTPTPTPTATPTPSPTPTPNTPPSAAGDAYSVNEDATLNTIAPGVLGNDTDAQNDSLTAVVQTSPANAASFTLNTNGSFSYTPNANFNGTDSFTYTASDGNSSSNTATVTITVTEVNDSPTAANDSKTTNEDTTLVFSSSNLTANDAAGPANESAQTLTVTMVITTANTNGTVSLNNGQISYQPAANYNGAASFDYKVCDNGTTSGQSDPQCTIATVNVTVNAVNDAPVANGGSISTDEDTPSSPFALTGSDADNDALTFEIVTAPVKGTYNAATGIYTPNANANGSDSFTFIAKDAVSQSSAATVSITINPVNDAPTATAQSVTTDEDTAKAITLSGADVDGDSLTYSASQPSQGSVSCTGTSCTYTPTANYNGSDSFTFKTNDGQTDSPAATVSITVNPVNDNPDAINDSATVAEDSGANNINIRANDTDVDGNTLSVTSATQGANGSVAVTGGGAGVSYTPNANFNGSDSFTYTVSDGNGGTDTATVSVTITPVNDNPDAVNDSATVAEDSGSTAVNVLTNDTDADGDTLSITVKTNGTNGTVVITGGGAGVSYTPAANFNGSDSFTYTVSDGNGGTDTATVSVTVTSVNDPPDAVNDSATVNEDSGANSINVRSNDSIAPDTGETLSVTSVTQGANGAVAITGGGTAVSYTPNANFYGSDSFTYAVSDGNGGSDTATVSITVNPVNDAPVFTSIAPLSQTVDYSDAVTSIAITVGDVDNTAASLVVTSVAALPAGLTLAQTPGTGNWTISGVANVPAGSYTINLKVTDSSGAFTAGNQITITVAKEKAATAYTGDQNLMTAGPSITTATVRLGAHLTQQADGFSGDITKAKVTFELFKNGNLGGTPDLVVSNVAVDSNGDALITVNNLAADTYSIYVKVDSANAYWIHSNVDIGVLNVTVPTNDLRSNGGGWVADSTSSSGKANFGFTVQPGKNSSAAPKGNSTFVFRGLDGFNYVVKGNSWQSGYLQFSAEPGTTIFTRSNFKGNCNVQKIDPATGLVVESSGNYNFEVFTKDGDLLSPRAADAYSITVWDRYGAVWHKVGSATTLVGLGGGNITNKNR